MYNGIGLSTVRGTATSGHVQTNRGYVRANRRRHVMAQHQTSEPRGRSIVSAAAKSQGNRDIQLHHGKRQIENELLELRLELEDKNTPDDEIDRIVDQTRKEKLTALQEQLAPAKEAEAPPVEDHEEEGEIPDESNRVKNPPAAKTNRWGSGERTCFNCGKPGHLARDCPEPRRPRDARKGPQSTNAHVQALHKEKKNEGLAAAFGIRQDQHVEGKAFDQEAQQAEKRQKELAEEKEQAKLAKAERKKQRAQIRAARKEKRKERRRRRSPSSSSSDSRSSYSSSGSSSGSYSSYSSRSSRSRSSSSDSRSSYSSYSSRSDE